MIQSESGAADFIDVRCDMDLRKLRRPGEAETSIAMEVQAERTSQESWSER
jgi:hypothetical protein